MELLPIDVSEKLYAQYSATLMNPEPLTEEMRDLSSNFRATYEKGIVITREQLYLIWGAHKKNADLSEPYDVGVLNALALVLDICCDRDPVFEEKPESLQSEIKGLGKKIEGLQKRIISEQEDYSDRLAEESKLHADEIDRLDKLIVGERVDSLIAKEDHATETAKLKEKIKELEDDKS